MHGAASPFVPGWPPLSPHELYQQNIQCIKPLTSVTPPTGAPLNLAGYSGRHVDKRYSPGLPNGCSLPGSVDPRASPLYNMMDYHNASLSTGDQHSTLQKHHTSLPYSHSIEGLVGSNKEPEQLHRLGYMNGFNGSHLFHKDEKFGLSAVDSHSRKLPIPTYSSTDSTSKETGSDRYKFPSDLVYKPEQTNPFLSSQVQEQSLKSSLEDVYKLANTHSISDIRSSLPYHNTAELSRSTSLPQYTASSTAASTPLISSTQPRDIDFHHRNTNKEIHNGTLISPTQPRDNAFHIGHTNKGIHNSTLSPPTQPRDNAFHIGHTNKEIHNSTLISPTQPRDSDFQHRNSNKEIHSNTLIPPTLSRDNDFHYGHTNQETSSNPLTSPQHAKFSRPSNTLNPKASKIAAEIFAEAQSSMCVPSLMNKLPPFSNISNTMDKSHNGYSPYDFDSSERLHVDPRLENKLGFLNSTPSFNHWSEFNTVAPNVSLDKRTNSVLTHSYEKAKEPHKPSNKPTKSKNKKQGSNNHSMSMKEMVEKKRADKSKRTVYHEDPKINELVDAKVQAILAACREKEHQKSDNNVKSVPDTTLTNPDSVHMPQSGITINNKQDYVSSVNDLKYQSVKQGVSQSLNGLKPVSDHGIGRLICDDGDKPVSEDLYQQVIDMRLHKRETLEKSQQGLAHGRSNLCREDGYSSNSVQDLSRKTPTQDSMSLQDQVNEMRMHRKLFDGHVHSDFNNHTSERDIQNSIKNSGDSLVRESRSPIQHNPLLNKTDHLVPRQSQNDRTLHQQVDEMRNLKRERHASNESVKQRLQSDSRLHIDNMGLNNSQNDLTLYQQVDEMRNLKRERHASNENVKQRSQIDSGLHSKNMGMNLSLKKDPYEFDDFHDAKQFTDHRNMLSDIRKQNGFNSSYLHHKDSVQIKTNPLEGVKMQNYGHYEKNHYTTETKQHYHSSLPTNTDINGENKLLSSTYTQKVSQGNSYSKKLGSKPFGYKSSLTLLKKSHKYHGKLSLPIKKPTLHTKVRKPGRPPGRPPKIKNEVKDKFADDLMKNLGFPPLTKTDLKSYMSQKIKLFKNGHLSKDSSELLHKTTIPQSVIKSAENRIGYPDSAKCMGGVQQTTNCEVKLPKLDVVKQESIKTLPRPKSVDSALSNYCKLKPARRPRSLSFDCKRQNLLKGGIKKESVCDKRNGALSDHQKSDVDFITHHVQNLKRMVTGQLEDYSHELETNTVRTVPQCGCLGMDKMFNEAVEGPYYTHLGAGRSVEAIRKLLEKRTGSVGKSIRIEKLRYTAKEGKSSQGCPIAKWIIRRSAIEEKYLALVRHRPGHFCETAWLIIGLVAWEGVPTNQADDLYSYLTDTLPENGFETERRCGTNDRKTCACQGIDLKKQGASFSFGCSWSMYFNGCKFARSQTARKFKLKDATKEPLLEDKLQKLATQLAPLYKQCAPQAHFNQSYYSQKASDCRLGNEPQGPFSGVTACADFCAHAHKDIHNMNNGSTVVVTLTKHRGLSKPDDEQLHVLPLYVLDPTDEFGSYDGQYDKIQNGSLEVLHHYPLEARVRSHPLESCRKRRQNKQSPGKKRGRPFRQPSSPWSGSTSSNQSTPKKGKFSRDYSFLHSQDSSQSSGSQGGTPVKHGSQGGTPVKHHFSHKAGPLESTPVRQHTQLNPGSLGRTQEPQHSQLNGVSDIKKKPDNSSHIKRFPPGFEGLYSKFWDYFELHGSFPPPAFMAQYARACQMMNSNQGDGNIQNNSQQLPPSYQEATNSTNRSQYKQNFDDKQNISNHQRSIHHPIDQPASASQNNLTNVSPDQDAKEQQSGSEQLPPYYHGAIRETNGPQLQHYPEAKAVQNGSQNNNNQGIKRLETGLQKQPQNYHGAFEEIQNSSKQHHQNYQGTEHTDKNFHAANHMIRENLPSYQQAIRSQQYQGVVQTGSKHYQTYQGASDPQSGQKQSENHQQHSQSSASQKQNNLQTDESLESSQHSRNIAGKNGIDESMKAQTYYSSKVSPVEKSFEQESPANTATHPPRVQAADNIETHREQTTDRQQIPSYNSHSLLQHQTNSNIHTAHNEYTNNAAAVIETHEQSSSLNMSSGNTKEYPHSISHTYNTTIKSDLNKTNNQSELATSSLCFKEPQKVACLDVQSKDKLDLSKPYVTVTNPFSDNTLIYISDQHQVIDKQSSPVQGAVTSGTHLSQQQQQHQSLSGFDQTSHKGSKVTQQTTAIDLSSSTSNIGQNSSIMSNTPNMMNNQGHDLCHPSSVSQQGVNQINRSPLSLLADAVSAKTNEVERKSGIHTDRFLNSSNSHETNINRVRDNEILNGHINKSEYLCSTKQASLNSCTTLQESGPHSKNLSSSSLHKSYQHEQYNGDASRANGMHKDTSCPLDLAAKKGGGYLDPWRNEFHNFHANEQKSSKMSWNMFNYNSQNLPSQNNPSAMFNGQLHFNENKEENSIDPDVKCHMEYNEEAFRDPNIGGVAVALCHGAVLFEVAKRELHATTGLKNPNRFRPTRISLVFYQHKNLNNERHGMYAYAKKIENMKLERIERMREQRGFVDMEEIENSFKGGKKRKLDDLKQTDEEFDIMKTSAIHYRYMLECQSKREMSVTTSSFKTNWVKPEPMVTGPYQRWV